MLRKTEKTSVFDHVKAVREESVDFLLPGPQIQERCPARLSKTEKHGAKTGTRVNILT
jgi:hypothetical protein